MTIDYSRPSSGGRVILTKERPSSTVPATGGIMTANLNWSRPAATADVHSAGLVGGLRHFAREARKAVDGTGGTLDLDLGCLWETVDGAKGVIQALGGDFGGIRRRPWIELDGDDRSGANVDGENLRIDLAHARDLRRVLVFAYIYAGAPSWDVARGRLTLSVGGDVKVQADLDDYGRGGRFCAAVLLTSDGRGGLTVSREMRYTDDGQSGLDRMYGWGMSWSAGRK